MTIIKFIGLLIITNLSTTGANVVMGHIPGMMTKHDSIIAYERSSLISADNWPKAGSFSITGTIYDYVLVTNENVVFTGPTDPFINDVSNIPHLSCCCATMKGLRPEYGDKNQPATTKASAFFAVDHGQFFTMLEITGAVTSALAFNDPTDLTITGILPSGRTKRQLVLKQGSMVLVANTPIAALEGRTMEGPGDDFLAYYNMGLSSATCTMLPGNQPPNPCLPSTAPCSDNPAIAKRTPLNEKQKRVHDDAVARLQKTRITDVNCSNSSWP